MDVTPIVAVVPVKDRLELTAALIDQLRSEDVVEIVICDNGSSSGTRKWLDAQADVTVLDCPELGVNEMWNRGVELALQFGISVRIAVLNNDLWLGDGFLKCLSAALDADDELVAVCGNYDQRAALESVVETTQICAGRYDGTGGFAGFAFMLRGSWLDSSGYRFPEECKWWFGDNDLMLTIQREGRKAGIVVDAEVEHLDGGGQTAGDVGWSQFREQTQRDRAAFEAKWRAVAALDVVDDAFEAVCSEPSDIGEHVAYLRDLVVELDAERVVELGVRGGRSTVAWLVGLEKTGGHLWGVDLAPAPPLFESHPRFSFVRGHDCSSEVLAALPTEVDIVFVDSDHRYELTRQEIEHYAPRVRAGGVMVFHDTAVETFPHHHGSEEPYPVRRAVQEAFPDRTIEWRENNNGLAVVRL